MQATEDIKAANSSMKNKHFEWACFQSQQSAEKALKALLMAFNINNQGNGLVYLLKEWNRVVDEKPEENHKIFESKFQELLENCQNWIIIFFSHDILIDLQVVIRQSIIIKNLRLRA